jgi:hypothetical protein
MEVIPDSAEVAGASPTLLVVQDLVQALSANGRALQAVEDGALPIQEISGFVEALKVWWEGADVPVSELGDLLRLEPRYTLEVDPTFDVLLYFSDMCPSRDCCGARGHADRGRRLQRRRGRRGQDAGRRHSEEAPGTADTYSKDCVSYS